MIDKGDNNYDVAYFCPACGTPQLITSGNTSVALKVDGVFVCEQCGYKRAFVFGPYGGW